MANLVAGTVGEGRVGGVNIDNLFVFQGKKVDEGNYGVILTSTEGTEVDMLISNEALKGLCAMAGSDLEGEKL